MKILILDPDPAVRRFWGEMLTSGGHELVEVPNGDEALLQIRKDAPDVVVIDSARLEPEDPGLFQALRSAAPGAKIMMLRAWGARSG